jgi:hypothetical protein
MRRNSKGEKSFSSLTKVARERKHELKRMFSLAIAHPEFGYAAVMLTWRFKAEFAQLPVFCADVGSAHLERIHKLFNVLEKVRAEALADFSRASIESMDMISP